ncbi:MAG TPA: LCP family protein [Anaerolineaceae bacterium]|nr:LCP family protein [Anaerolineaceae bacterium]HOD43286.1 LCP family protein [Anaerolineaceae bacterium]HQF44881.1 LCP family protein [Anaerolineaceae bacterium]HQH34648.1 LCP family protein [Anaerolineaceae bacterium]HQJ02303.1 LCP family protein [Anaerolineaceae bacterium]
MTQKNTSQPRRRVVFDRLTILLLIVFVILAIVTGVAVFRLVKNTVAGWNITPLEGVSIQSTTTVNGTPVSLPGGALQPEGGPTAEPWDGNSRVTILLMGLDYRDWEAGEVPRTDSMILLTIDPMTSSAGMLSIPRDMWVNIPGYDYYKINQAYYFGELDQLPGGGPALAVKTVESFIGVPINYYAQIDFGAFVRVIDEIGGVKIDVPEKITIDPIGDSPKVTLEPGRYTLNGELALAYARSRKGSGDDFARAERQQQVILAVRDRILQFDQMPSLVTKAPKIYQEISSGLQTNLTFDQAFRLGLLAMELPAENIRKAVIGPSEVEFAKSPDGLDILIPYPDRIRLVRDQVFTSGDSISPIALTEDLKSQVATEAARISVQNGSYTTGLAALTAEFFRSQGLTVTEETNASDIYSVTTIYVLSGKPYTVRYLADIMQVENIRIYNRYEPTASVDLIVTLGTDWADANPMP